MYQTDNKNLIKKIISEDLNFDDTIKYRLAMEQRGGPDKKSRDKEGGEHVAAPEEKVRALQAKETPTRKLVC